MADAYAAFLLAARVTGDVRVRACGVCGAGAFRRVHRRQRHSRACRERACRRRACCRRACCKRACCKRAFASGTETSRVAPESRA
ncbi:hypothetical protein C7S16_4744 [Burkholderia thailandensis]|uniref:Uncharacterized protein n=1 Tax=Burkholderia thailandensis TaxID=57975 RepID=A0AAW9CRY7_BURTH|nr:hypothetical protein [Burkholderia thailandensis]MDW9251582.1 hypothetical protein [Burkholderia thailandensis]